MPLLNNPNQDLKGYSFKDKNLAGADFSNADIRSCDFSKAILEGANFRGAKAGLEPKQQRKLIAVTAAMAGIAGLIAALAAGIFFISFFEDLKSSTVIIAFALTVLLAISVIKYGYIAIAGGLAVGVAIAGAGIGELVGTLPGSLVIALFLIVGGLGAITGAGIYAIIGKSSVLIAGLGSITGALILPVVVRVIPLKGNVNDVLAGIVALVIAGAVEVLAGIVAHSALKGNERLTFIRTWAIAFAATGGTSFYGADLTDADFTSATLKSTDLRKANLTRTRWHQAEELDRVRPGETYLSNAQIRQLVIGKGQNKNFDGQDLRGVNLQGAILADASFIGTNLNGANLRDVDLSRARLVQTQLDETDLTGATLTGAIIEDWGITSHTKLHEVRCEYVFMRYVKPGDKDQNPRRKPDNWQEIFCDGDFADFIKPIVDTLDLYHNQGVDPRAIAISFKRLAENHPEAELEIVAMERRGQENFLLRAKTAPDADRSALSAEYCEYYNKLKAFPKDNLIFLLAHQDGDIQRLETAFRILAETPTYNLNNAKFGGGFAAEGGIQTGGTFYDFSSNQNLSEATTQIQQLLTQLQAQGYTQEDAQQQVAEELVTQAKNDPTVMGKLVKWGQSLGDAAAQTTVTEGAKAVVKLALRLLGIPLP